MVAYGARSYILKMKLRIITILTDMTNYSDGALLWQKTNKTVIVPGKMAFLL